MKKLVKRLVKILIQVTVIYLICKLGGMIQAGLHLPIPGSIIGLLLLFILLLTKLIPESWIKDGATFLLSILTLFFVPSTVGIINYFHIFKGKGVLLILTMIVSTCIVMLFSSFIAEKWSKKSVEQEEQSTL